MTTSQYLSKLLLTLTVIKLCFFVQRPSRLPSVPHVRQQVPQHQWGRALQGDRGEVDADLPEPDVGSHRLPHSLTAQDSACLTSIKTQLEKERTHKGGTACWQSDTTMTSIN